MAESAVISVCYHCGDTFRKPIVHEEKTFCCTGCYGVYSLIQNSGLSFVYNEGNKLSKPLEEEGRYQFLLHEEVASTFHVYKDAKLTHVRLSLPNIHCSSCVWLLENLHTVDSRISHVEVNMMTRYAKIIYDHNQLSLYELANVLSSIGYPPVFRKNGEQIKSNDSGFYAKLGVAGFCFGNIMLFSFPEYLNFDSEYVSNFRLFFSILILALSLPILLFSASDYFRSALSAIKTKTLTLDVSIVLGIMALYGKSVFDIMQGNGPGYMDSFAGFVFFLLIGKWFQNYTYDHLSFNNQLESYFPLVVFKQAPNGEMETIKLEEVRVNDRLILKRHDVVPIDGMALDDMIMDYSFVTGESVSVEVSKGETVYAGGKLISHKGKIQASTSVDKSRISELWKQKNSGKTQPLEGQIKRIARYFLASVLIVSVASGFAWLFIDGSKALFVSISVLIVACPCALALSLPFTVGNASRLLGRNGFYIKDARILPILGKIKSIVFDKTGTITSRDAFDTGEDVEGHDLDLLYSSVSMSGHPKSKVMAENLKKLSPRLLEPSEFSEIPGRGIEARFGEDLVLVGSASFVEESDNSGKVWVKINGKAVCAYDPGSALREGVEKMVHSLEHFDLSILSGDNDKDLELMLKAGFEEDRIWFDHDPVMKKKFIEEQKSKGDLVLMVGDGLNDTGALQASDFGIAVADNIYGYLPKCDAILEGRSVPKLSKILKLGTRINTVLKLCFALSISYNLIGLYFAVTGQLSPLIAAILMPLSSISVVVLTSVLLRRMR